MTLTSPLKNGKIQSIELKVKIHVSEGSYRVGNI